MIKKIHYILPHLLFVILTVLIFLPSQADIISIYPFLTIVLLIEAALLYYRKNKIAVDISIIVYVLLILWETLTSLYRFTNNILYPAPENVFATIVKDQKIIIAGIFSSLKLLGTAFFLAIVLGVGLGLFVGISDRLSGVILPIVRVISPIPPIVYSPYAVAILPSFRAASIFIVTMTVFWSIFMNMILSVRQVDKKIMDSAKTLNLSKASLIWNVLLPYSLPGILNSITVSVSTSFLVLTAAEMMGATSGLGWYIKYYSDFANYTRVIAGIIIIGVVVSVLNALLSQLKKVLISWK